eukprot:gene23942-biopygen20861
MWCGPSLFKGILYLSRVGEWAGGAEATQGSWRARQQSARVVSRVRSQGCCASAHSYTCALAICPKGVIFNKKQQNAISRHPATETLLPYRHHTIWTLRSSFLARGWRKLCPGTFRTFRIFATGGSKSPGDSGLRAAIRTAARARSGPANDMGGTRE